jgi:CRISPR-associated protein Cmr3
MKPILLEPEDVIFFRDGRPMEGSLAGHGAAWPAPHTINAAFHAALHRSGLSGHPHTHRGNQGSGSRWFGSLRTLGPFPVRLTAEGNVAAWFFPRPADAGEPGSVKVTLAPHVGAPKGSKSSLPGPGPVQYPVVNLAAPSKAELSAWWSGNAWDYYLHGSQDKLASQDFTSDSEIFSAEHSVGIGMDSVRQTQDGQRIYSAHYLRLRPGWAIGACAGAPDAKSADGDLIADLLSRDNRLLVGGQQRICTARRFAGDVPMPVGLAGGFKNEPRPAGERWLVKWVLLSPAIWPRLEGSSRNGHNYREHPGGWLPNWIDADSGRVLLREVKDEEKRLRRQQKKNGQSRPPETTGVDAWLVAAVVPKPVIVTGWGLANGLDRCSGGAKSTHLAVPAGAVYYFEAASVTSARELAGLLNWHGANASGTTIRTRCTLCGEKGFGLGVCGKWTSANCSSPP